MRALNFKYKQTTKERYDLTCRWLGWCRAVERGALFAALLVTGLLAANHPKLTQATFWLWGFFVVTAIAFDFARERFHRRADILYKQLHLA